MLFCSIETLRKGVHTRKLLNNWHFLSHTTEYLKDKNFERTFRRLQHPKQNFQKLFEHQDAHAINSLFPLYRGLSCFNTLQTLTSTPSLFVTMIHEGKKYLLLGLIFPFKGLIVHQKIQYQSYRCKKYKYLKIHVNQKKTN